jgi:CubicO group peptidase (beta-lactamase class C family)
VAAATWQPPVDARMPAATVAKLQAALDGWVGTNGIPGLAAAVVSPDGAWAGAAGVDGAGREIKPDSAFAIESITKTFTAAEVLLLASRGTIDLDAPVASYLDLPFDAGGATIRQLATMTSGFPGFPSDAEVQALVAKDLDRAWTAIDIVALAKGEPRVGTLGGPSAYNGINYVVLGLVIERVTHESLAKVLRRDLITPAGLDRVWMQPEEKPQAPLTAALDGAAAKIVDPTSEYLPSMAAASMGRGGSGIAGDAPSLARWGYLLYGGLVIDPTLVSTMMSGDPNSGDGYGFGTMLGDWEGTFTVGHAGDWMGYSSIMVAWPDTRTAVVVLAPRQGMALNGTLGGWVTALHEVVQAS